MEQLIRQRYTTNNQARDSSSTKVAKVKTNFRHSAGPENNNFNIPLASHKKLAISKQYEDDSDDSESVQENLIDRDEERPISIDNDADVELQHTTSNVNDENDNYNSNFNNNIRLASIILNAPTESSPTVQNKRSTSSYNQIKLIPNDRSTPLKEPDDYLVSGRISPKHLHQQRSNQTNSRETILPAPISRSAIISNGPPNRKALDELDNPQLVNGWLNDDKYSHENLPNTTLVTTRLDNLQPTHHERAREQQQQQQLVFIAFGFAIFLIIVLAVYNWFHKRRKDEILASTKGGGDLFDSLPLFPSNCGQACVGSERRRRRGGRRKRNKSTDSDSGGEELRGFVSGQAENHGCGSMNKRMGSQLVGRVLTNKNATCELEGKQTELEGGEEEEGDERVVLDGNETHVTQQLDPHPSQETHNIDSISNHDGLILPAQGRNDDDERKLKTMVILRQKIINHPLMINARSGAKPRVKLIKESVRKFIDDEAADMRNGKRELTLRTALESRLRSLFSNMTFSNGLKLSSGRSVLNEKMDKEVDLEEGKKVQEEVEKEEFEMNNLENFLKPTQQQQQKQQELLSVEIHATNKSENEQNDDTKCDLGTIQRELSNSCLLPSQNNRKLSPFSDGDVLNDAYSSLSACSLFSSSPIEAQQLAQTCACSYAFANPTRSALATMQFAKSGLDSAVTKSNLLANDNVDLLRCKSQGHSPFSPAQANNYNRPCCSASPLPFAQVGGENQRVNSITETASCCRLPSSYHHPQHHPHHHDQHHHQQHHNQRQQAQQISQHHAQIISKRFHNVANSNTPPPPHHLSSSIQCNSSTRKPSHNDCEHLSCNNLLLDGSRHASTISQYPMLNGTNKCINHIQRQYENYYDDEQEDAYRRLTASIGMEFGLGFNDDDPNHHQQQHHHHHHIPPTASPSNNFGYTNYNMQAANVDDRFNHFGVDHRYSCYTGAARSQLDSLAPANHLNFQSPFIESSQSTCKCCINNKDSLQGGINVQQTTIQHQQYSQQFVPTTTSFENSCQYLFRSNGGSAGELLSSTSTSTSFGGSDSGFAATSAAATATNITNTPSFNSSRQLCRNPSCICQSNATATFVPQAPMSILVQQPSIGTPPPPLSAAAAMSLPQSTASGGGIEQPLTRGAPSLDEHIEFSSQSKQIADDGKRCASNENFDRENAAIDIDSTNTTKVREVLVDQSTNQPSFDGAISKQVVSKKNQQPVLKDSNSSNKNMQCCKPSPRYRHRRRYSQKTRSDMISELSQWNSPAIRTPRRMSIAGDHVTQSAFSESANQALLHRDTLLNRDDVACEMSPQAAKTTLNLQQRSSVAPEVGWNSSASSNPSVRQAQQQQQQQHQTFYNQFKTFSSPYNQHRPSEPSLFDNHHPFSCVTGNGLNGNSNCSSSGGSSSGIGASGSMCTNTPTSAFPNSSFAVTPAKLGTEFFADFPVFNQGRGDKVQSATAYNYQLQNFQLLQQQQYQQLIQQQHNNQCNHFKQRLTNYDGRATNIWPPSKYNQNEIATCPSRKFSLPVQLESQVAERMSPNKARLLFKENLQRDDSTNISLSSSSTQNQAKSSTNDSISARQVLSYLDSPTCASNQNSNSNGNNSKPNGLNRMFDRRMSSQTITRQSSFWLEDNSADSIISLATTSGGLNEPDGSQVDVNQSWCLQDPEEKAIQNFDYSTNVTTTHQTNDRIQEDHGVQQTRGSNRPSISSLILSADSIESVKQKPITPIQDAAFILPELDGEQQNNDSNISNENNSNNNGNNGVKSSESFQTSNKEWSSSNSTLSATGAKEKRLTSSLAHMRNRLSSSTSTSSTTSSPSPDFSKPSERILGLASKSSSISKRHMFSKLRSRRYPRLVNSTGGGETSSSGRHPVFALHQHSAPDARMKKNESSSSSSQDKEDLLTKTECSSRQDTTTADTNSINDKSSQSCSQDNDPDVEVLVTERPISDINSASL